MKMLDKCCLTRVAAAVALWAIAGGLLVAGLSGQRSASGQRSTSGQRAAAAKPATPGGACRAAIIDGEVEAGQAFSRPFGNGLRVYLQPIAAGWILRVLPAAGAMPAHDAAEMATPPYESVSPLSLSTDFAFRAQDAIGWNPRRFHYAASAASFHALSAAYERLMAAGRKPPAATEAELAARLAETYAGTLNIVDARIMLGTADQWRMAEPMAQHLDTTAHTVVDAPAGQSTALGRILAVRFRVELALPPGFVTAPGVKTEPQVCSAGQ